MAPSRSRAVPGSPAPQASALGAVRASAQDAPSTPPTDGTAVRELEILIRSSIPIIVVETREEARVLAMLVSLAPRLAAAHTPVFQWSVTDGVRRIDMDFGLAARTPGATAEALDLLRQIRSANKPGVYVLLDFHPYPST